MPVSTTNSTQTFSGGQSVLTFTFTALSGFPQYIQVNVVALTGGTITALSYGTQYTVTLSTTSLGGTVIVTPSYGSNYNYVVYRQTSIVQNSSYANYNTFPATTLQNNLDQLTMIDQEQLTNTNLSLTFPLGTTGISTVVPTPVSVTNGTLFLALNTTATAFVYAYAPTGGTTVASTAAQAQTGTDNTTFMTPTMTTVAIKQWGNAGTVTSVSSSTSDITIVSTSTTPIITSVNASTSGSNVIVRTDAGGYLHAPYSYIKCSYSFSANTNGANSVSGSWLTYPLNTKDNDTATIATLSSSTLIVPYGTYLAKGAINFFSNDGVCQSRLVVSPSTVLINGMNSGSGTTGLYTTSPLSGEFSVTGTTTLVFQYQVASSISSGLGTSGGYGTEVYGFLELTKIN